MKRHSSSRSYSVTEEYYECVAVETQGIWHVITDLNQSRACYFEPFRPVTLPTFLFRILATVIHSVVLGCYALGWQLFFDLGTSQWAACISSKIHNWKANEVWVIVHEMWCVEVKFYTCGECGVGVWLQDMQGRGLIKEPKPNSIRPIFCPFAFLLSVCLAVHPFRHWHPPLAKIFIHIQFHLAAKVLAAWRGGKADCDSSGDFPQGMGKRKGLERRWKKK